MTADSAGAAEDLADILETFADLAAAPGEPQEIWVTIGTPHGIEQRTVTLSAGIADWIGELLREEAQTLETGRRSADHGPAERDGADAEPAWW